MSETAAPTSYTEVITDVLQSAGLLAHETDQSDSADTAQPAKSSKSSKKKDVSGRALVDIPAHGLKCGDYATIPADAAEALAAAGEFDTKATQPE